MTTLARARCSIPALGVLLLADLAPAQDSTSQWTQWLGPRRANHSLDTGLLDAWPDGGPPLAWKAPGLGVGFSSVTGAGDRLFTMGDVDGEARLFALSAKGGEILWSTEIGEPGGERNPGPRATPGTDGKLVFALGQDGSLVCVTADDGEVVWKRHLVRDFDGAMMSKWNYSESPLIDDDLLVCTPGGAKGTVLALQKATGEVAWRCGELTDAAPYSSLLPVEIGGVRQYVVFTDQCVAGVAAENGELLWRADRAGKTAICSTPVYSDGIVFVSSGYNIGCNAFRITVDGGEFEVEEIYAGKQLQSHHGGMVLVGDHVYGLGRRNLKCIELATGDVVWEDLSVGKGSITYADGHLIVRSERGAGEVALVEATPKGYVEKGRFEQPDRSEEPSWAYPVVFGGKLYVRDQGVLLCFDVRRQG